MTSISDFLMAKEIGRVPSSTVPLNAEEESRFAGLAQEAVMIDVGKEAYGPATPQEQINMLIAKHAQDGHHVVRLKSGDATVFGRLDEEIEACEAAGVSWHIVPGITSASAAVAGIGQSLTRRGRNATISTGGRHAPCVGIRAVPIGEAMMACVLADHLLRHKAQCG